MLPEIFHSVMVNSILKGGLLNTYIHSCAPFGVFFFNFCRYRFALQHLSGMEYAKTMFCMKCPDL